MMWVTQSPAEWANFKWHFQLPVLPSSLYFAAVCPLYIFRVFMTIPTLFCFLHKGGRASLGNAHLNGVPVGFYRSPCVLLFGGFGPAVDICVQSLWFYTPCEVW